MLEIEEGQRCRKRSENTHSHTLTAVRVFQQNPMTAGTNKKKISNDEEATLHSLCTMHYVQFYLYGERKILNSMLGFVN